MSVDPEKASRVLDLLEAATRRGDLGKDEAASILSSWLADQKRQSCSDAAFSSSTADLSATQMQTQPQPPPLPPRPQVQRQRRRFWLPRWFAACVTADGTVATAAAAAAAPDVDPRRCRRPTPPTPRSQTPLPSPPLPTQVSAGHEYALYGGLDARVPACVQQDAVTRKDDVYEYEEYEECSEAAAAAASTNRQQQMATPPTVGAASNTADSGVFSC